MKEFSELIAKYGHCHTATIGRCNFNNNNIHTAQINLRGIPQICIPEGKYDGIYIHINFYGYKITWRASLDLNLLMNDFSYSGGCGKYRSLSDVNLGS